MPKPNEKALIFKYFNRDKPENGKTKISKQQHPHIKNCFFGRLPYPAPRPITISNFKSRNKII